jgi:hypothetical protein
MFYRQRTDTSPIELIRPGIKKDGTKDKTVATLPYYSPALTPAIKALLTPFEVDQMTDKLAPLVEAAEIKRNQAELSTATSALKRLAAAIGKITVTYDQAREIMAGIEAIKKALNKEGFKKKTFSEKQKNEHIVDKNQMTIEEMMSGDVRTDMSGHNPDIINIGGDR